MVSFEDGLGCLTLVYGWRVAIENEHSAIIHLYSSTIRLFGNGKLSAHIDPVLGM